MAYVKGQELEKLICQVVFQGDLSGLPASFYLGIGTGSLPATDATLAAITEVGGTGYARKKLDRNGTDFPTLQLAGAYWKVQSKLVTWVPGGDWAGVCDYVFLTDAAAGAVGRFFGAVTIDAPFLLLNGDTYDDQFEYQDR